MRKIANEQTLPIWVKLLESYQFDINKDVYEPVMNGYDQRLVEFDEIHHLKTGAWRYIYHSKLSIALNHHIDIKRNRYAWAKVEKTDCL